MNRISLFAILTLLTLTLVCLSQPVNSASAAPAAPEWASWELTLDFDQNEIIGLWHVTIGTDLLANPTPLHVETIALDCWTVGAVDLMPGYAEIDLGERIDCKLPDFSETVDAIITAEFGPQHVLNLPSTCNCAASSKGPVTVQAKAELSKDGQHPLFAHPNIDFALGKSGKYVQQTLAVNGIVGASVWEAAGPGLHEQLSTYSCKPANCFFDHYLNGTPFDTEAVPANALWLSNDATIISIGDGTHGKLYNISVDPGCFIG